MKKLLSSPLFCFLLLFFFSGCNAQDECFNARNQRRAFLSEYAVLMEQAFKEDISPISATKSTSGSDVKLRLCLPLDEVHASSFDVPEASSATTWGEIRDIVSEYSASLEISECPSDSDILIPVSYESTVSALQPMVENSRRYLYSIGMTDMDISEMIQEAETDESSLIPFTFALLEAEQQYYAMKEARHISILPRAYAVSWGDVGHCALQALGVDIIASLRLSGAKVWTKAALKSAFKAVAKRVVGPIGVAIFAIEFSICIS